MMRSALPTLLVLSLITPELQAQTEVGYGERCDRGDLIACAVAGLIYQTGAAGTRDLPLAIRLYERACNRDVRSACRRLELLESERSAASPPQDELARIGYVADAYDGAPLGGAIVRIYDVPGVGERRYVSDRAGRVVLDPLPRGNHRIDVQRGGYAGTRGEIPVPWPGDFLILLEVIEDVEEASTGLIFGRITEEGSDVGVSDVDVIVIRSGTVRAVTNRDGRFLLSGLEPGPVEVRFERLGYEPRTTTVTVRAGRTVEMYATLSAQPVELEPVQVTVSSRYLERSGFYHRSQTVPGDHFTFRDIERLNPMTVGDVVRRASGVTVVSTQIGWGSEAISNRRRGDAPSGRCWLQPYYNGVPLVDFNLELLPPEEIEALEVYQGANVPIEYVDDFQPGGPVCGVVLIWTRDPSRAR